MITIEEFKKLIDNCITEDDFKQLYSVLPLFKNAHIKIKELKDLKAGNLSYADFTCANPNCNNLTLRTKQNYCCNKCCRSDLVTRNRIKESWKYNKEERCQRMRESNSKRNKEFYKKRKEKYIKTMQERYGVDSNTQLEKNRKLAKEQALKRWNNKSEEQKQAFAKKMCLINKGRPGHNSYANKSEEERQIIRKKQYETKKKNHTFITSSTENEILKLLNIKFSDLKYQYRSEEYPFNCDFYIPSLKLYIEYQGHWSHGTLGKNIFGPYNPNDSKHETLYNVWQEKAKTSKFYKIALHTWTVRDPLKRKIAKEKNLNWLEFFTMEDFIQWYDAN